MPWNEVATVAWWGGGTLSRGPKQLSCPVVWGICPSHPLAQANLSSISRNTMYMYSIASMRVAPSTPYIPHVQLYVSLTPSCPYAVQYLVQCSAVRSTASTETGRAAADRQPTQQGACNSLLYVSGMYSLLTVCTAYCVPYHVL